MAKRSAGRRRGLPEDVTTPIPTGRRRSTLASRLPPLAETWQFPLFVALVHWLIVQIPATLAYRYGNLNAASPPYGREPVPLDGWVGDIVNPMRMWDGLWYRLVAIEGYEGSTAKAAFWPLYPWTIRAVHNMFGIEWETAGYLIANICFLVALILLYRLVLLDFNPKIARTALWAIAIFPTAFFFSAVYTESPFLMLMVGALLAARVQRWWLAGAIGALAALTRSYGMFLVLPFAVLMWQQYGENIKRAPLRALAIGLPLLGPAFFSWHLDRVQGNWQQWQDVQQEWNRYDARPWDTLRWAFQERSPQNAELGLRDGDGADWDWLGQLFDNFSWDLITSNAWRLELANSDTLELVCTLLFIALALIGFRLLPFYQTVYLLPGLLVPLFQPSSVHTLMSMPRFGLTLFPLFIVMAILLSERRITPFLAVLSAAMLVLLTVQFSQWYWVS
ncbi:MAG: glycosyltransferase family 39 protein [Chloroflexota bacterium]|nr:glycosyltransferase family 39 protein [Chloroflexota bacterium]